MLASAPKAATAIKGKILSINVAIATLINDLSLNAAALPKYSPILAV